MNNRTYLSPASFRQSLESRLQAISKNTTIDLQRIRRKVAFERFLARLFYERPYSWVLKGGYALEVRFELSRATKDLDLGTRLKITGTIEEQQSILHQKLQKCAAINLDDLIPDKVILKMESHSDAADFLNDFNQKFLRTNERHFRKYLESSRLLAAYISTTVVADIEESSAGLSNFSQATIWTIPGLPKDKEIQIKRFFTQMMKTRFPEVIGER